MMNDEIVANGNVKRRLPLWMLGDQTRSKSDAVNLNNTRDDDKGCEENEERFEKCSRKPKSRSQKKGNDDGKFNLTESSSTSLVKCRQRNQKRGAITHDAEISGNAEINEEVVTKKRKCRQKTNTCLEIETDKDVKSCLENEETEDLTVEDLMSIAKEYVEEDNDTRVISSLEQRDIAGNRSQDIASSCSSLNVTDTIRRVSESQGISSPSNKTGNETGGTGIKPTMSGNPVEDMLDLFLGPLLKKTQEQEKANRLTAEDKSFSYEVHKQHSTVDVGEEPIVVVAKKKSSLKDKVAMFLD